MRLVEDRGLLDGFRRGDAVALTEVYREYAAPLFALLAEGFTFDTAAGPRRFAGFSERWERESHVQEVFVRAFTPAARAAYDGLRPYRNYLFTIARNLVIDGLRLRDQGQVVPDDETLPDPAPVNPEEDLSAQEITRHCEAFLASLDLHERALFDARFRQGLSVQEAARRLGISEHHVKRGEQRLKKRFFVNMKEHGYFEGYRVSRAGLEKACLLLVLIAGAQR